MQWQPGHKLTSRPYEIEKELGEGGFGITYKAKNLTLDIPVVIKTPNRKLQRDGNYEKYVANFTKEAKQLAKIGLDPHPHIVRVTNLFEEDKLPCIVMDFIPGQSLYDLVLSQGKLSEAKAVEYVKQIGSALSVCHKAGIVHRDVHPNNILIHADNGKAVLIDFGISGTTQTSRNTHSGNRAFAPWEQIAYWEKQDSKTPQVDVYTLAASLYYLVTGQEPTECLARKYNDSELIEPKQLNPELSDTVNQAIIKGVEVYPENRPSSMQEWLNLLSVSSAVSSKELSGSQFSRVGQNTREDKQVEEVLKETNYVQEWLDANSQASKKQKEEVSSSSPQTANKTPEINHRPKNKVVEENVQQIASTHVNSFVKKDSTPAINKVSNAVQPSKKVSKSKSKDDVNWGKIVWGFFVLFMMYVVVPRIFNSKDSDNCLKSFSDICIEKSTETEEQSNSSDVNTPEVTEKNEKKQLKLELVDTLVVNTSPSSIKFSPDGQTLATGNYDKTIELWDVATKQKITTLSGHSDYIDSVAFSPDGQILASGSSDDTVKLWDVSTQEEIATLTSNSSNSFISVTFSPDSQILAGGGFNNMVELWDVSTKEPIITLTEKFSDLTGDSSNNFTSIAISPDSQVLAGGGSDTTIKLWSGIKQEIAILDGHSDGVSSIEFSPDGQILASGSLDATIKLWHVATKQEIATLVGHSHIVNSVAFSPDGQMLASGSDDGTIKLWNVANEQEVATVTVNSNEIYSVAFSSDGQTLASSSDSTIKLWKISS